VIAYHILIFAVECLRLKDREALHVALYATYCRDEENRVEKYLELVENVGLTKLRAKA